MNKTSRWMPRAIYIPLALVPFVYLVVMVIKYRVDVPFLDGWELVPLLEKLNHHTLTLRDLWVQHNEHRIVFPLTIMLGLAKLTSWNISYELGANLALALGTFLVLAKQVENTSDAVGNRWVTLALPAVAVLVFSFRQFQNWLWGWQLTMYLSVFGVVGSIHLLANPPFRWWRFVASMLPAIVAMYSFANGMLIWPIGIVMLALAPHYKGKLRWKCLGTWLVVGGIAAASYLYQYQKPVEHPPLDFILKDFRGYIYYVLSYLGSPVSELIDPSRDAGIVITILTPVTVFLLLWRRYVRLGLLAPYIGICLYVFGSALVTGLGRAGFGVDQALSSRYCTYTSMLWSCNLVFLMLLVLGRKPAEEDAGTKKRNYRKPQGRSTAQAVLAALALASMVGMFVKTGQASRGDLSSLISFSDTLKAGRDQVVRMVDWTDPSMCEAPMLYPRVEKIVPRAKIMAKRHWSLFRNGIPDTGTVESP